jgi:osmoprotectant transport system ATP-binding protein
MIQVGQLPRHDVPLLDEALTPIASAQAVAAGERALHRQGETPQRIKPVQRASLAVKHQAQRAGQRWMGAGDRR